MAAVLGRGGTAMSQSDVAALRSAYEAFAQGDFAAASKILAPDVEWVEHGRGMPYSGTWHGPDSVVNDVWTSFATQDRKSTRLNSSHANISYAVFCLKQKKN